MLEDKLMFTFIIGLALIIFPKQIWYLIIGWLIKGAEPYESTIKIFRLIGILFSLVGCAMFVGEQFPPV
jgi:hypothetical protein